MLMMNLHSLPQVFKTFTKIIEFYTHAAKFRFVFYQENSEYDSKIGKEIVQLHKFKDDSNKGELISEPKPLAGIFEEAILHKVPVYDKNILKSELHNENIDLMTTQNLATIPVLYMDQLVIGAYQVSGNFRVRDQNVD